MADKLTKILLFFSSLFVFSFLAVKSVLAVCPLCVVAVGAGVEFSRWLGIDDTISGLWIGGLIVSLIMWTIDWLNRKKISFKGKEAAAALTWYLLTIIPLYMAGFIGNQANAFFNLYGFNFGKMFLGIIVGSIAFWWGADWYFYLKEKNKGRAYFPFQKVVMPISPLILLSIIFYFLTK
jgi:hypothetical protein